MNVNRFSLEISKDRVMPKSKPNKQKQNMTEPHTSKKEMISLDEAVASKSGSKMRANPTGNHSGSEHDDEVIINIGRQSKINNRTPKVKHVETVENAEQDETEDLSDDQLQDRRFGSNPELEQLGKDRSPNEESTAYHRPEVSSDNSEGDRNPGYPDKNQGFAINSERSIKRTNNKQVRKGNAKQDRYASKHRNQRDDDIGYRRNSGVRSRYHENDECVKPGFPNCSNERSREMRLRRRVGRDSDVEEDEDVLDGTVERYKCIRNYT